MRYLCAKLSVFFMRYILIPAIALLCFACNNRQAVETLQDQTMAVHDAAMKDMAEMSRTGRALKQLLAQTDTLPAHKALRDSIAVALTAIEKADADMMDWMQQYRKPDDKSVEEAVAYLNAQKQKIEQNLRDIQAATAGGRQFLKK